MLVEVRSLWEPTPQESPIPKGAQSLKEPNLFGAQSLFELNVGESLVLVGRSPLLKKAQSVEMAFGLS